MYMSAFDDLLAAARDRSLPPVGQWRPGRVGEIDIRIARDGEWHHEGRLVRRQALVRLFSTILRREGADYCLVTPAEKLRIRVDDAPFVAIDMEADGEGRARRLAFKTNVGDVVLADAEHEIVVETVDGQPRPYVEVRSGLRALIARPVYYRLADLAEPEPGGRLCVWSAGCCFALDVAE